MVGGWVALPFQFVIIFGVTSSGVVLEDSPFACLCYPHLHCSSPSSVETFFRQFLCDMPCASITGCAHMMTFDMSVLCVLCGVGIVRWTS